MEFKKSRRSSNGSVFSTVGDGLAALSALGSYAAAPSSSSGRSSRTSSRSAPYSRSRKRKAVTPLFNRGIDMKKARYSSGPPAPYSTGWSATPLDSGIGGNNATARYRKPRSTLRRQRWNRAHKFVAEASSVPFIYRRLQQINDPVQVPGSQVRTYGLAPGFVANTTQGAIRFNHGQQGYFASPCLYWSYDTLDTSALQVGFTGSSPTITMTRTPHWGIIPSVLTNQFVNDNPGLNAFAPAAKSPSRYRILSASLSMDVTNTENFPVQLKEYKCWVRNDIPDDMFSNSTNYTDLQPHLQLFRQGHIQNEISLAASAWDAQKPGASPYQCPLFTKYVKILEARTLTVNGGQTVKSFWKTTKPRTVDLSTYQDANVTIPKGCFFFFYTVLGNLVYDATEYMTTDHGPVRMNGMCRVTYEVSANPVEAKTSTLLDHRMSTFVGAAKVVNDDTMLEQTALDGS